MVEAIVIGLQVLTLLGLYIIYTKKTLPSFNLIERYRSKKKGEKICTAIKDRMKVQKARFR